MRIATGGVRTGFAMTGFPWSVVYGRRATARVAPTEGYKECLEGGRTEASAPTEGNKKCSGRADVGSELSAASGRSSEVSEWPRSKFPASVVRQRRNFGHRNRVIGPYESVSCGA